VLSRVKCEESKTLLDLAVKSASSFSLIYSTLFSPRRSPGSIRSDVEAKEASDDEEMLVSQQKFEFPREFRSTQTGTRERSSTVRQLDHRHQSTPTA